MTTTENNKPVRKIRIGSVSATIWKHPDSGFYTTSLERNYKDKEGQWKSSNSFSTDELIVVAKVAAMAADAILALQSDA